MSAAEVGCVFDYTPEDRFDRFWCREGVAVSEARADGTTYLSDTYWGSGMDRHILTDAEVETAQIRFRLADFRPVERGEVWEEFSPADREIIPSQHGLQVKRFVRLGAAPDHATIIANASEKVREAEAAVESANWRLECGRRDLAHLVEKFKR